MNQKAFTLFEIIIAMLVVGILSALAVPKVVDLVNEARRGDELNTVGNVRSGIALTYLGNVTRGITPQYPQNLDNATLAKASPTNPVYDLVLQHGITKSWEKLEPLRYRGPTGQEYEYDPTDGSFEAVAALPPPPPSIITWAYPGTQITDVATIVTDVFDLTQTFDASTLTLVFDALFVEGLAAFTVNTPPTEGELGVYGVNDWEFPAAIQQTSDGGYIIAGDTYPFGAGEESYLVKIDAYGNLEWSKTYGGSGDEWISSILETPGGGYIMAGSTDSFGAGGGDVYLTKVDSSGIIQWSKTYGGSGFEDGTSIQQTPDGYIISGHTTSSGAGNYDTFLTKVDSSGALLWSKTYGGNDWDIGTSSQQTSDGGYIMTGGTYSFGAGYADSYVTKTDSDGNIEWSKTYGGSDVEHSNTIQQTSDGGYIMASQTGSFGAEGYRDAYLIKIDSGGNLEWSKTYHGESGYDYGSSAQQTPDGGYILLGFTNSFGTGSWDSYLTKTDSSGNLEWSKTYGGSGDDDGQNLQQTSDGGYVIAGTTDSFGEAGDYNFYIIKTDSDGNVIQ